MKISLFNVEIDLPREVRYKCQEAELSFSGTLLALAKRRPHYARLKRERLDTRSPLLDPTGESWSEYQWTLLKK